MNINLQKHHIEAIMYLIVIICALLIIYIILNNQKDNFLVIQTNGGEEVKKQFPQSYPNLYLYWYDEVCDMSTSIKKNLWDTMTLQTKRLFKNIKDIDFSVIDINNSENFPHKNLDNGEINISPTIVIEYENVYNEKLINKLNSLNEIGKPKKVFSMGATYIIKILDLKDYVINNTDTRDVYIQKKTNFEAMIRATIENLK